MSDESTDRGSPRSRRRRAVVLVGSPAAPYSRGLRAARALASEGYDVELAAMAADDVPDREREDLFEIRRYRPSGIWARLSRRDSGRARAERHPTDGGHAGTPPSGVARRVRNLLAATRRWVFWPHTARGWWSTLARELEPADLYHACGSLTVAAALAARRRRPVGPSGAPAVVIYDAVDDVMEGNNVLDMPRPLLAIHAFRERRWARQSDAAITVSEPLADRLEARWQRRPRVVPNYPMIGSSTISGPTGPGPLRRELGLGADVPIVLFQGRIGPLRGLDEAAEAVLELPRAVLVLLGFGQGYERERTRDREPRFVGRHFTIPARHPDELLAWTADADAALIPVPPVSINQRLTSPNKFWEAIAAGTPVIVPASITFMAGIITTEDVGVVAATHSVGDLAVAIQATLDRHAADPAWRSRIRAVAIERHSWPLAAAAYIAVVRAIQPGNDR